MAVRSGSPVATRYWRANCRARSIASLPPEAKATRSNPGPARPASRAASSPLRGFRATSEKA